MKFINLSDKTHDVNGGSPYTGIKSNSVKVFGIMYKILVVDADPSIQSTVGQLLEDEGYDLYQANDGQEALASVDAARPDLMLIAISLPEMDGLTLCRTLRHRQHLAEVPIIFLTDENSPYSVAQALDAGGDDYVRKPFVPRELAARIRAHLRRANRTSETNLPIVSIRPGTHQVFVNDQEIFLTRIEFELLRHLTQMPDQWHSTDELLIHVWQYPQGVGDAALVRNHIRNLRCKVEDNPDRPTIIRSRHGRGYVVRAHVMLEPA
jgi:DNA-binding response OmpR family regulator